MKKKKRDFRLDEKEFIKLVLDDIHQDKTATDEYRKNRETWIRLAQNEPVNLNQETDVSDAKQEFQASLPLIATAIDQIHSRQIGAVYQNKPLIRMAPTDQYDVKKVKAGQDFINYRLLNCTPNFHKTFDENGLITLTEGQSYVFQTWVREERKVCHKHQYPAIDLSLMQGRAIPRQITIEEIIDGLFNIEGERRIAPDTEIADLGDDRYRVKYQIKRGPDDWSDHEATLDFELDDNYEDPLKHTIHVKVISTEIVFEGVKMLNVNLDFLYFPKDVMSLQPPDCPHMVVQSEERVSDVRQKMKNGEYNLLNADKMNKLKDYLLTYKNETEDKTQSHVAEVTESIEGTEQQIFPDEILLKYICYYSKDVDGDGIQEEIAVTMFPDAGIIADARFLEEVFKHGKRPVRHVVYDIRPYSIFGKGIPENLCSIQELYDDVWNQMLNYGAVIALPFFFYEAAGNMEGDIYKLRPGEGFPVSSLDSITFPNFNSQLPVTFAELQQIYSHYERRGKVNESIFGRQGQARQTATATLKLLGESMEGMQINFNRFRQCWADIFKDYYLLHMAYMPDRMKYRVFDPIAKQYDFKTISRQDLMEMPDINFDIHLEHTSDVFQREMWTQLFQLTVNPYNVQTGIVQPHKVANLMERIYRAYKIEDVDNFITFPDPIGPPMDPMDEVMMMNQGDVIEPNPQENTQQHLQFHTKYLQDNWNMIQPDYRQIHIQHIVKTQMMIQQQMQMMQMAQSAAMMQQTGQGLIGEGGGGGGFMAQPSVGREPMAAIGQAQAAGNQNVPGVNTSASAPPMQG